MWFIVNTSKFREQQTKEFLEKEYPDIIKYVYLPKCRIKYLDANGDERFRFQPLMSGMLFIKVDSVEVLLRILSPWGYFVHEEYVRSLETGDLDKVKVVSSAHLLCYDAGNTDLITIVQNATVPDVEMEHFIYYTDKISEGIEGLSIVDKRYEDLILVNDTIRILSGPMKGRVGVVKQVKKRGRKDRHLLLRFGKNFCISVADIRQYDMQVEHEATRGPKAEAVGAWRAIDQMIGYLQALRPTENAHETLRQLLTDYQKKRTAQHHRHASAVTSNKNKEEDAGSWRQEILEQLGSSMRNNFRVLANYCNAGEITLDRWLKDLIPDAKLRPFLTPTSGIDIPAGQHYAVLRHNDIIELILRCNLRDFFQENAIDHDQSALSSDEDYEYYAHFALLQTAAGKVKVICSWGGFYDYYASQNADERQRFHSDLESKKYLRLLHLLTQSGYRFEKVSGIGGFSIVTDIDYTEDDMEAMAKAVAETFNIQPTTFHTLAAAAVEVWLGTRLLVWRQLLQRYVLLHKVPVTDLPQDKTNINASKRQTK